MANDNDAIKKRKAAAKKILSKANLYKVCEGCESVIIFDSIFCPVCESYRFNNSLERVKRAVEVLSQREQTSILPSDFI